MRISHLHQPPVDEPAPLAPDPDALVPGRYLTDGRRLFRVVTRFAVPPETVLVVLEDCVTLEMIPLVPAELADLGVTAVAAAA